MLKANQDGHRTSSPRHDEKRSKIKVVGIYAPTHPMLGYLWQSSCLGTLRRKRFLEKEVHLNEEALRLLNLAGQEGEFDGACDGKDHV